MTVNAKIGVAGGFFCGFVTVIRRALADGSMELVRLGWISAWDRDDGESYAWYDADEIFGNDEPREWDWADIENRAADELVHLHPCGYSIMAVDPLTQGDPDDEGEETCTMLYPLYVSQLSGKLMLNLMSLMSAMKGGCSSFAEVAAFFQTFADVEHKENIPGILDVVFEIMDGVQTVREFVPKILPVGKSELDITEEASPSV